MLEAIKLQFKAMKTAFGLLPIKAKIGIILIVLLVIILLIYNAQKPK